MKPFRYGPLPRVKIANASRIAFLEPKQHSKQSTDGIIACWPFSIIVDRDVEAFICAQSSAVWIL
jgi:hypothetical protein